VQTIHTCGQLVHYFAATGIAELPPGTDFLQGPGAAEAKTGLAINHADFGAGAEKIRAGHMVVLTVALEGHFGWAGDYAIQL